MLRFTVLANARRRNHARQRKLSRHAPLSFAPVPSKLEAGCYWQNFMMIKRAASIFTVLLVLGGCSALQPDYEAPTVTINSFRSVPSEGGMPSFEIGLRVVNPNREPLELVGAAYTVSLEGRDLIKGVANDLPVIEGYGEGTFTLTATADLFAGARFLTDLVRSEKNSIRYELEAKLDVGGLRPTIRVRDAGEIALSSGQ